MLTFASILLVPTAALVGVLRDWRLCLYSLAVLYLLVALIEALAISPLMAGCQLAIGGTTLAVVYLCGRQIFCETHRALVIHGRLPAWEYLFETVVAAVAAVGAALFARAHPLFALPGGMSFAWAWLGLAGLFMIVLAGNILEMGLGLLVFDTGLNLLILSTSLADWWLAILIVELLPIALALLLAVAGIRLSHFGQGVGLDLLLEKAPFVMAKAKPVHIRVRRRSASAQPLRSTARI